MNKLLIILCLLTYYHFSYGYIPGEQIKVISLDKYSFGEPDIIVQENYPVDPTFIINKETNKPSAKGWIKVTKEHISIKIIVKDSIHFNDYENGNIWKGDGIQIGIDGKGDGSREMDTTTLGAFGNDDIALGLALGKKGVQGWIYFVGSQYANRSTPELYVDIQRNENNKTTAYELNLPLDSLNTEYGQYPNIGISVQVNESKNAEEKQKRYYWGRGAGGKMNPGMFKKVGINFKTDEIISLDTWRDKVWDNTKPAEIIFAYKSSKTHSLSITYDGQKVLHSIGPSDAVKWYSIKALAKKHTKDGTSFQVKVIEEESKKEITKAATPVFLPRESLNSLIDKIDSLLLTSDHELFTRHLNSVKALVLSDWANIILLKEKDIRRANETVLFIKSIEEGLGLDAGKAGTYLTGKRSMIISYISKRDRTLQYYIFTLPKDWDPNKKYPLYVELHGSGNQNPINGLYAHLGSTNDHIDLAGYDSNRSYAQDAGLGYHITPFGRGNSGYRDIGEIDVWEAFHDVSQQFNIDENRRYLYGFSMGGDGTWHLASRTPDLWAAIAIYSGAVIEPNNKLLTKNINNLPIWMWCGEKDFLFNNMKGLEEDLKRAMLNPVVTYVPDLGHNYKNWAQEEGIKWLSQFTRNRPDQFSYVADTEIHMGTWGVKMKKDIDFNGFPSFNCVVNKNIISIDSKGAKEITVNMGKNGLQLTDNVKVIWNGNEVYDGPVKKITIGKKDTTNTWQMGEHWYGSGLINRILDHYH